MIFINVIAGNLALCNNRHNGDKYENEETLGDHYHIFQLRLCLCPGFTYGDRGMYKSL